MTTAIDPKWAWAPYRPTADHPWDLRKAGHLYRRAAFGATWAELNDAVRAGPESAIERLLRGREDEAFEANARAMAASIRRVNNAAQLAPYWMYRLVVGPPHPLREKLTLFWHNHFATSNAKVKNAGHMLGQFELMHRHALGSFRELLQDMSKDPAMMVWLDTSLSKKGMPNENYARELMELFSLGLGHYTEQDIREAARAFTGWELKAGQAHFNAAQHDGGDKTVLGQAGKWKGEDVVRICLDQKACPQFIVAKLFRFLVSETLPPTPELLEPLAEQFRASDFDFGALVTTVLRSNLFFAPQAYRSRVKSPVDFVVGIVRGLEGKPQTTALAQRLEGLGQQLFQPPSVKGWDGGPAWLNGQTLLFRQNLALALASTEDAQITRFPRQPDGSAAADPDPARLAHRHGKQSDEDVVDFFLDLFLQGDVPAAARDRLLDYLRRARRPAESAYGNIFNEPDRPVRAVCHLVLTLPEFQLD